MVCPRFDWDSICFPSFTFIGGPNGQLSVTCVNIDCGQVLENPDRRELVIHAVDHFRVYQVRLMRELSPMPLSPFSIDEDGEFMSIESSRDKSSLSSPQGDQGSPVSNKRGEDRFPDQEDDLLRAYEAGMDAFLSLNDDEGSSNGDDEERESEMDDTLELLDRGGIDDVSMEESRMVFYRHVIQFGWTRKEYKEFVTSVLPGNGFPLKRDTVLSQVLRHFATTIGFHIDKSVKQSFVTPTNMLRFWFAMDITWSVIEQRSRVQSEAFLNVYADGTVDIQPMRDELNRRINGGSPIEFRGHWDGTNWLESLVTTFPLWHAFVSSNVRKKQRTVFVHLKIWSDGWLPYKQRIDSLTVVTCSLGEFGHSLQSNISLPFIGVIAVIDDTKKNESGIPIIQRLITPSLEELARGVTLEIGEQIINVVGVCSVLSGDSPGKAEFVGMKQPNLRSGFPCPDCQDKGPEGKVWVLDPKASITRSRDARLVGKPDCLMNIYRSTLAQPSNFSLRDDMMGLLCLNSYMPCSEWPGLDIFKLLGFDIMHCEYEGNVRRVVAALTPVFVRQYFDGNSELFWKTIIREINAYTSLNALPAITPCLTANHFKMALNAHNRKSMYFALPFAICKVIRTKLVDSSCQALIPLLLHVYYLEILDSHVVNNSEAVMRKLDTAVMIFQRTLHSVYAHYGIVRDYTINEHYGKHYTYGLRQMGNLKDTMCFSYEALIQVLKRVVTRNSNNRATPSTVLRTFWTGRLSMIGTDMQPQPSHEVFRDQWNASVKAITINFRKLRTGCFVLLRNRQYYQITGLGEESPEHIVISLRPCVSRCAIDALGLRTTLATLYHEESQIFQELTCLNYAEPRQDCYVTPEVLLESVCVLDLGDGDFVVTQRHLLTQ